MRTLALILAMTTAGCAININKEARIYDLSAGTVIHATFNYQGHAQGGVSAVLPGGEHCSGEYSTLPRGAIWGGIYNAASGTAQSSVAAGMGKGSAVVVCGGGFTMECEYVTSGLTTGNGYCRDNRGTSYRLMF
jgi:hypothetical protein